MKNIYAQLKFILDFSARMWYNSIIKEGGVTVDRTCERIAWVIDEKCGGNRSKFARAIGITPAFAAQLYDGTRIPSDRTISDICREFGINEVWIRTGEGEPFQKETRQEQIMRFATQTVKGSDEFRKAFVSMLAKMDSDDWTALAKLFDSLADEIKKSE